MNGIKKNVHDFFDFDFSSKKKKCFLYCNYKQIKLIFTFGKKFMRGLWLLGIKRNFSFFEFINKNTHIRYLLLKFHKNTAKIQSENISKIFSFILDELKLIRIIRKKTFSPKKKNFCVSENISISRKIFHFINFCVHYFNGNTKNIVHSLKIYQKNKIFGHFQIFSKKLLKNFQNFNNLEFKKKFNFGFVMMGFLNYFKKKGSNVKKKQFFFFHFFSNFQTLIRFPLYPELCPLKIIKSFFYHSINFKKKINGINYASNFSVKQKNYKEKKRFIQIFNLKKKKKDFFYSYYDFFTHQKKNFRFLLNKKIRSERYDKTRAGRLSLYFYKRESLESFFFLNKNLSEKREHVSSQTLKTKAFLKFSNSIVGDMIFFFLNFFSKIGHFEIMRIFIILNVFNLKSSFRIFYFSYQKTLINCRLYKFNKILLRIVNFFFIMKRSFLSKTSFN